MSPEALVLGLVWSNSLHSLLALAIGFAVAGALSNGYQALTAQPATFRLLGEGDRSQALAHVPLVIFAAPFIIARHVIVGPRGFGFAMLATILAGFWSLMSGTFVVMLLEKARLLLA